MGDWGEGAHGAAPEHKACTIIKRGGRPPSSTPRGVSRQTPSWHRSKPGPTTRFVGALSKAVRGELASAGGYVKYPLPLARDSERGTHDEDARGRVVAPATRRNGPSDVRLDASPTQPGGSGQIIACPQHVPTPSRPQAPQSRRIGRVAMEHKQSRRTTSPRTVQTRRRPSRDQLRSRSQELPRLPHPRGRLLLDEDFDTSQEEPARYQRSRRVSAKPNPQSSIVESPTMGQGHPVDQAASPVSHKRIRGLRNPMRTSWLVHE